jgi:uncharacterized protein
MMSQNRMNAWCSTYSGRKFYPFNPDKGDIDPVDIAQALSMQCRFNGHVKRFYSVAEHSFYVSHIVSPRAAFYGLMHDAPEAYIGDMIQPLKECFPEFKAIEDIIMDEVAERFQVPIDKAIIDEVHAADKWIVFQEGKELLSPDIVEQWELRPAHAFKPRVHIDPATFGKDPHEAFVAFMVRFGDLVLEEFQ